MKVAAFYGGKGEQIAVANKIVHVHVYMTHHIFFCLSLGRPLAGGSFTHVVRVHVELLKS